MKPISIAESMAALRSQLDKIEQKSTQSIQETSTSSLKEHMDVVNQEYLSEGAERPVWNYIRGLAQNPAIGRRAANAPEVRAPDGSVRGVQKVWDAPSPEAVALNKSAQTAGKVGLGSVGAGALMYGGWAVNDWVDSLNGKVPPVKPEGEGAKPDPKKPKQPFDPYILTLQRVMNLKYGAGLVEDGYWGEKTQAAFDQYINVDQSKINPKTTEPETKNDQPKTNDLKVDPLPPDMNKNDKPVAKQDQTGQGAKPLPVAPPTPNQPPVKGAETGLSQQEQAAAEIKSLLQQLDATKAELGNDAAAMQELQNIDRQYQ